MKNEQRIATLRDRVETLQLYMDHIAAGLDPYSGYHDPHEEKNNRRAFRLLKIERDAKLNDIRNLENGGC